jgi:hypothetical protein
MLLRTAGVLLAFGMVALTVMFGSGSMGLGSIFVVLGGLVVFISSHEILVVVSSQSATNSLHAKLFQ